MLTANNVKERTLEKLREESKTLYQGMHVIMFIYVINVLVWLFLLFICVQQADSIRAIQSDSSERGLAYIVRATADLLLSGDAFTVTGEFKYSLYVKTLVSELFSYGIVAYIFLILSRVFRAIRDGETPFTERCVRGWKQCYRIFACMATICFLTSFIIRPLIIGALSLLMAACFFYALGLIFEYGAQLQTESDETL